MFIAFLIIGFLLMILELILPSSFFLFSIGLAAFVCAFISIFIDNWYLTFSCLPVLSLLILYLIKRWGIFNVKEKHKTNRDAYIGKKGQVEEIKGNNKFAVKVYGEVWLAICEVPLECGDIVIINNIKGNTLFVSKDVNI